MIPLACSTRAVVTTTEPLLPTAPPVAPGSQCYSTHFLSDPVPFRHSADFQRSGLPHLMDYGARKQESGYASHPLSFCSERWAWFCSDLGSSPDRIFRCHTARMSEVHCPWPAGWVQGQDCVWERAECEPEKLPQNGDWSGIDSSWELAAEVVCIRTKQPRKTRSGDSGHSSG